MATKIFLPGTASTTPISPTPDSAWEDTSILARVRGRTTKVNDTLATVAFTDSNATDRDVIFRQYVLRLTPGQTITGSQAIEMQCRVIEANTGNNMFLTLGIRVIAANGTTVQKTVLAVTRDNTEADGTTLTNRRLTATSAATNYTTVGGDCLVIEIGMAGDPTGSNTHSSSMRLGDSAAAFLSADDTSTTDNNPYVQLADTLTFQYWMPATVGTFALTGITAGLKAAKKLAAGTGAFTLTGNDAALTYTPAGVIDFYPDSNQDDFISLYSSLITGAAQSFTGTGTVAKCKFYLAKNDGSPSGDMVAKIYADDGGAPSAPTGAALATSTAIDASTMVGDFTFSMVEFTFPTPYALTPATTYWIAIEFSGTDSPNNVLVGMDQSSPTHAGHAARFFSAAWNSYAVDLIFEVSAAGGPTYTLTADVGNFTVTGNAATLSLQHKLAAGTGAFSLTGNAAALTAQKKMAAGTGAFTLTGQDATLTLGAAGLIDSYSESNFDDFIGLYSSLITGAAQQFTGIDGTLGRVQLYLSKGDASPTGDMTVKLYADDAEEFDSLPTGSALATATTIDASTLTEAFQLVEFTFPTPYTLTNGTKYWIAIEFSNTDTPNAVRVGMDETSSTHPGHAARFFSGVWNVYANDLIFYAYEGASGPTYTLTADAGSFTVTGNATALRAAKKMATSVGAFTLTGNATALKTAKKMAVSAGSFALTGNAATLKTSKKLAAGTGAFVFTGKPVTFDYSGDTAGTGYFDDDYLGTDYSAADYFSQESTGPTYTLTASAGTFSLTGNAVALKAAHKMTTTVASFTLTGNAAALKAAHKLAAAVGTFSLSGQAATFTHGRTMTAGAGSFVLTGNATGLAAGRKIAAGTGVFTLTTPDVTLSGPADATYVLSASTGTFALTGNDTRLAAAHKMTSAAGSFTLTGQSAAFSAQHKMTAGVGAFTLTGNAANLTTAKKMAAAVGAFTVTGQSVVLAAQHKMTAGTGVFTLTGNSATFPHSWGIVAGTGSFTLTGIDVDLIASSGGPTYTLTADAGTFSLSGQAATFKTSKKMTAGTGVFTLTGNDTGLFYMLPAGSTTANPRDGVAPIVGRTTVLQADRRNHGGL